MLTPDKVLSEVFLPPHLTSADGNWPLSQFGVCVEKFHQSSTYRFSRLETVVCIHYVSKKLQNVRF